MNLPNPNDTHWLEYDGKMKTWGPDDGGGRSSTLWCEDLMKRTLSSQGLHHDTLLWLLNTASVYDLLTGEGSLMGIGDLMSEEDCCLRERKEKVIELGACSASFPACLALTVSVFTHCSFFSNLPLQ